MPRICHLHIPKCLSFSSGCIGEQEKEEKEDEGRGKKKRGRRNREGTGSQTSEIESNLCNQISWVTNLHSFPPSMTLFTPDFYPQSIDSFLDVVRDFPRLYMQLVKLLFKKRWPFFSL